MVAPHCQLNELIDMRAHLANFGSSAEGHDLQYMPEST
eukprot:CAMPEP_0203903576 /NCGR_PEP_ID=MMETSP0359-20131031/45502_1 /ASSEMBLY_ACC=CAM_ASM_000338 /TAXON_ID=268821 /ORGANISM="Scrippsiella Hangoei, Strain SHTV-5" /LENGTH=37 /DNA_ID= /DNA_START= /DNA_END= /DNA_ORIENTATION=